MSSLGGIDEGQLARQRMQFLSFNARKTLLRQFGDGGLGDHGSQIRIFNRGNQETETLRSYAYVEFHIHLRGQSENALGQNAITRQ